MAGLETSSPTISWSYSTLVAVACSARRPVPSWVCSTHHLPCGHITRCVFMSYRLTPRLWSPYCRCCSHDYLLGKLASIAFYWQWKHRRTLFPLRLSITVGCLSSGWAHQCWRLPGSPGNGYGPSGISACAVWDWMFLFGHLLAASGTWRYHLHHLWNLVPYK